MSKIVPKIKAKNQKKEKSAKKAKKKKIIITIAAASVIAAAACLLFTINSVNRQNILETYSYQRQTVRFFVNGNFAAVLPHNVRKNGTYTKAAEGERTAVSFNVNGNIETGWIINNELHIPSEWDDGHGHANIFQRAD